MAVAEEGFGGAVRFLPHRDGRGEQGAAFGCEVQAAAATIFGIGGDGDEAAALEGLEGSGERGAVHGQQCSDGGHAGGLRAIERHQERELAVGEAQGAERFVETARQGTRRALDIETEAAVADPECGFKRKSRSS